MEFLKNLSIDTMLFQQFGILFAINLVAIALFSYGLYYRKHKDVNGCISYTLFNIFLFVIIFFLSELETTFSVGFAIFGLLWLVRLRSDTFSKIDISYFLWSLALAIIGWLAGDKYVVVAAADALIICCTWIIDSNLFFADWFQTTTLTLDHIPKTILSNKQKTCALLSQETNTSVVDYTVLDINNVKDSVHMIIKYSKSL